MNPIILHGFDLGTPGTLFLMFHLQDRGADFALCTGDFSRHNMGNLSDPSWFWRKGKVFGQECLWLFILM